MEVEKKVEDIRELLNVMYVPLRTHNAIYKSNLFANHDTDAIILALVPHLDSSIF